MINGDAAGQPEFAGVSAFTTERQQQTPRTIKDLHVFELCIHDVQMSVAVEGDAFGQCKIARAVSFLADRADASTVEIEQLDAEISGIGNGQPLTGTGQVRGKVELTGCRAVFSPDTLRGTVKSKNNQMMTRAVDPTHVTTTRYP